MTPEPTWRKSSYSGSTGGQCVEVAACADGLVRIRDSKNPGGPVLSCTSADWQLFLLRVRHAALLSGPGT